jgi:hypothetical protein
VCADRLRSGPRLPKVTGTLIWGTGNRISPPSLLLAPALCANEGAVISQRLISVGFAQVMNVRFHPGSICGRSLR